jgi:hypothetical protein
MTSGAWSDQRSAQLSALSTVALTSRLGEGWGGHLIVDAPTGVVVEGLPPHRPPGVGPVDVPAELAVDIDIADIAEEAVEVGALLGQEPGLLPVGLPVLQVPLGVADVEVAGDEHMVGVLRQLRHPLGHPVEETVLVLLFGGVDLAGVDIGRDQGQQRTVAEAVVRLHPPSGPIEVAVVAESLTHSLGFGPGHHGHPCTAFGLRIMADRGVAGVGEDTVGDVVGGPHFLQGDEVGFRQHRPRWASPSSMLRGLR